MPLQSKLLRGDSKLEAAAVSDPADIFQGAAGEHVRKIQLALIQLDGAAIDPDGKYGPATAVAVLAYKRKRNIVNRSFETEADNIVGKMTMASLDREMLAKEEAIAPPRLARFTRANPADPRDGFSEGLPGTPRPVATRGLVSFGLVGEPTEAPRFFDPAQLVVIGEDTAVALLGAKGATLSTDKDFEELVVITRPRPTQVVQSNHEFIHLRGQQPGSCNLVARDKNGRVIARMQLFMVSKIVKPVNFAFLRDAQGGLGGVATTRLAGDELPILDEVNGIYNRQTGISFTSTNRHLHIKELDGNFRFITVSTTVPRGGEWTKIFPAHRDHNADFNVVFCKAIFNEGKPLGNAGGITEIVRSSAGFRDTVMDDRRLASAFVQSDGTNCAHEIGHALGEPHNNDATSLMSGNIKVGNLIDLKMAFRMRKNLRDFPQK